MNEILSINDLQLTKSIHITTPVIVPAYIPGYLTLILENRNYRYGGVVAHTSLENVQRIAVFHQFPEIQ